MGCSSCAEACPQSQTSEYLNQVSSHATNPGNLTTTKYSVCSRKRKEERKEIVSIDFETFNDPVPFTRARYRVWLGT
jgi:Fe-S-cluster-containing hydrogenase component 2